MMTSFNFKITYYSLSICISSDKNPYHALKLLEILGKFNHSEFKAQSHRHFAAFDPKKRVVNVIMARRTNV